ncbi:hypothetical protein DL93DRAFT_2087063 [Clavulina sp. PMI_390]|nr:hypothetical protein DL93DRAFT_2087063 [Clavulina sp. PMI_390]
MRYLSYQTMIVTTLTQIFFASRLWAYGRDFRVMVPLGLLILTTFVFGIWSTIDAWTLESNGKGSEIYRVFTTWKSLTVGTDLTISIYLCFLMIRRRSGIKSTDSFMNLIMLYGVASGALSSVLAVINLVADDTLSFRDTLLVAPLYPPVMVCAVLANLHLRSSLRPPTTQPGQVISLTPVHGFSSMFGNDSATTHPGSQR